MKIVSTLSKKMRIGLTSEGGLVVETLLRGQNIAHDVDTSTSTS